MDLTFNTSDIIKTGKHKEDFQDLVVLYGQKFVQHDRANGLSYLLNLSQNELTMDEALTLVNKGVLIKHWSISIKAPIEIMEIEVLSELPGSITTDEEGNEVPVKFKDWGDQPLHTSNDETQVILRGNINGSSLTSDEWKLFANSGTSVRDSIDSQLSITDYTIEVLSPKDLNQLRQDSNWKEEEIV